MSSSPVGLLLREWRAARRLSQLDLAMEVEMSTRHLSCVETGKAQPSRGMVERLADALDVPLRERNALLMAAGYAPEYTEMSLDTPQMERVRRAIEFILEHQEPYPAFVLDRHWEVLMANTAAQRIGEYLIGDRGHTNMLRQFFDPHALRSCVVNWEEVAGDLIRHLHDKLAASPSDAKGRALLDEMLSYPGVPQQWRTRDPGIAPSPILMVEFRQGLRFFSTFTTFGTTRDVTLSELHIECTFPADDATAELCRELQRKSSQEQR